MTAISLDSALDALQRLFPPGQVITDSVSLLTYSGDAGLDRGAPVGVVFPTTSNEIMRVVQWAQTHRIPLVARGSGTGLSGGAVAEHGGVIVEFARMEGILSFDERGGNIVAETGVITLNLDTLVSARGWYYPPDPSSGRASTLGGNIAENSGGPHCFKYGVTTNYVMGMEVVLSDGRCIQIGGPALDYPALDLVGLLTGSEGTLGLITQARLRLIRTPPAHQTLLAGFTSVEVAGQAVSDIIAQGLMPATMEMMDQSFLRIIEDFTHAGLPTHAGAALIIEVDGYPQSIGPQTDEIIALLKQYELQELRVARTEAERANIWYGRKSAAGAIARLAPMYYLVDGTVPRSKLAVALREINRICTEEYNLRVIYVFHAGDGNLHPLILIDDLKDQALIARIIEAGGKIMQLCIDYDGSITGEHGVGIEKRAYMPLMYSPAELQVMRNIKDIFDPAHLLNPAKILPTDLPDLPDFAPPAAAPATPFAPASAQEAAEAIHAWATAGQRIRLVGGGTKSRALPAADVQLATSALRGISTYARDDLYVTVGAGTTLAELQAELTGDRMYVPLLSPWDEATLGGIVATAFNAPLRMRYGSLRDLVLAATVVLPNAHVIRAGRPVVKNVAGYDLPRLFTGSHGSLGLLVDITLKLVPLPRARASLVVPVAAASGDAALRRALQLGAQLAPVRMVTSALLLCRGSAVQHVAPQAASAPYALIHTAEGLAEDVAAEMEQAQARMQAGGATEIQQVDDLAGSAVWAEVVRGGDDTATLIRLGVPGGELLDILPVMMPALEGMSFVADLANGLLYIQGSGTLPALLDLLRSTARDHSRYACTPCHGGSTAFDPWGYAPDGLALMRAIKQRWDAGNLFNPDAFLV